MITKLYTFYDTTFEHDVCHLFEHVVLRSFLMELKKNHYNRTFFGWLRGQTIDSTLFFDLGAYSDEIATLFDRHIKSLNTFDMDLIGQSLAHIEAEMKCTIEITDETLLLLQFEQLSNILKNIDTEKISTENPLEVKHNTGQFQEIVILVNVFSNSEIIRKSFLVLYPVLLDVVRDAAIDNQAAYPTGKSAIAVNDDGIGIAWRFRVKKDVDIKVLEDATNTYLRNYKIADHIKDIDKYQDYFNTNPSTNATLIAFYEQTAIQSTRNELSKLIAQGPLVEIMDNMTVRFSLVTGKLNKLEWDY